MVEEKRPWIEYKDKRVNYSTSKEVFISKKEKAQNVMKSLDPLKGKGRTARSLLNECQTNKVSALNDFKKVFNP